MSKFNPSTTLIIFALEGEAKDEFKPFHLTFSGIGKVNAAYQLMRHLTEWKERHGKRPDVVLNLGTAGSGRFRAGELVNCTRFIQRDFNVTALGSQPFATPLDTLPIVLDNGLKFPGFLEGTCGTGDNFMTEGAMTAWDLVDMEAYALAKVCCLENIPFGCLKYISDGADGQAAETWELGLENAARSLRQAVDKIFC